MSLNEIVSRFEAGTPTDSDIEHELAGRVIEEIARCKNNPQQAKLFADSRKTADHLLGQYLMLDQDDKAKMAEVYTTEERFRKIFSPIQATRKRLTKRLGSDNLELLLYISNYSKLVPIIESYVKYVENEDYMPIGKSKLSYFLFHHDELGRRVKVLSKESMVGIYHRVYRLNKRFKKRNSKANLESFTWGVNGNLKRKVAEADSLLNTRRRILEAYIRFVEESQGSKVTGLSLCTFLLQHNYRGNRVRPYSKGSLAPFFMYDFMKMCQNKNPSSKSAFKSMTCGLDEELAQRVMNATTLLPIRRRILENYINYAEANGEEACNLRIYLTKYDFFGRKVKRKSKSSLNYFSSYNFRTGRRFKKNSTHLTVRSMCYGIRDTYLVAKVRKYSGLLQV